MAAVAAGPNIEGALNDFLAEQRLRLSDATFGKYLAIVDLLQLSLNRYAYSSLSEPERRRFEAAYEAGDEQAFCHLFGPEKIPEHLGSFLGYFMVRKVIAGRELLRAAGPVTKRLVRWLKREWCIEPEVAAEAIERAARAGRELPRADKLGERLYELADAAPPAGLEELADEDFVEDYLPIERVEPGEL